MSDEGDGRGIERGRREARGRGEGAVRREISALISMHISSPNPTLFPPSPQVQSSFRWLRAQEAKGKQARTPLYCSSHIPHPLLISHLFFLPSDLTPPPPPSHATTIARSSYRTLLLLPLRFHPPPLLLSYLSYPDHMSPILPNLPLSRLLPSSYFTPPQLSLTSLLRCPTRFLSNLHAHPYYSRNPPSYPRIASASSPHSSYPTTPYA